MERHHIIPKCLGGQNGPDNLVNLTYSDHMFSHLLLAKIYGGGLAIAFSKMLTVPRYQGRHTRLTYAKVMAESRRAKGDGRRGENGRHTPAQAAGLKRYNESRKGKPASSTLIAARRRQGLERVGKPAHPKALEAISRTGNARSRTQQLRDLRACAKMLASRGLHEASERVHSRAALLTTEFTS